MFHSILAYYIEHLHLFSMEPYDLIGQSTVVFPYLNNMLVLIPKIEFLELVYTLP